MRGGHRGETVDEFSIFTGDEKAGDPEKLVSGHSGFLSGRHGTLSEKSERPVCQSGGPDHLPQS
ncbi:hypothetical protein DESC_870049 [Desulfosarcina cetonica]|nr:hypothetical protein DESC_870049 [Desulfosarcina cetonica]